MRACLSSESAGDSGPCAGPPVRRLAPPMALIMPPAGKVLTAARIWVGASRGDRSSGRGERWRALMILGVAALAVAMGVLTVVQAPVAAAVAAALALTAAVASMRTLLPPAELDGRSFRWIPLAWAFLMLLPVGHFSTGRTALTAVS